MPADQAKAWAMSPGFGVQFLDVTPGLREDINRLVQGLPVQPRTTPSGVNTQSIEALLASYRDRMNGDHYIVLALPQTADMTEIRAALRGGRRAADRAEEEDPQARRDRPARRRASPASAPRATP